LETDTASLHREKALVSDHAAKGSRKRFILPFATPAADRPKEFTKNKEMAAILYLAESNREKGESKLLKKTDEKIVFLAETFYPLWLIPYNSANLVFDGLNLASTQIHYEATPDAETFTKDIQSKRTTTEAYTATLTRNTHYFTGCKSKERTEIEGLVTTPDLKKDLKNYFPSMKEATKPFTTSVVLPPVIESDKIQAGIKQLSNLRKTINEDIENMNTSTKLLNTTSARRAKAIREEIKKTQERYRTDIKKTKRRTKARILQIRSRYNRRIAKTSKRFKKRLLNLNKNQTEHRKALRYLTTEDKRRQIKLQSSRRRKKKNAKAQWTLKLERTKRRFAVLRKDIEANRKLILHVENVQKRELNKQKTRYLKRIESATKIFLDLQGSKEAEIAIKRQEIARVEDLTRNIPKSIQEKVQEKKTFREEIENLTIQHGKQTNKLVYMPFYLARYEKGEKKRYKIYPPSIVGDMGTMTKMKGALGAAKVNALLQPRSEAIARLLNQLPKLLEKKPVLEKNVTEDGIMNSILLRKQLRIGVKKGLKELENENWISKNEHQTISKILYIYSSSMGCRTKAVLIPENDYLKCGST
jgi:hypothetical protein